MRLWVGLALSLNAAGGRLFFFFRRIYPRAKSLCVSVSVVKMRWISQINMIMKAYLAKIRRNFAQEMNLAQRLDLTCTYNVG